MAEDLLEIAGRKNQGLNIIKKHSLDELRRVANNLSNYFTSVRPVAYLDDITTKNVLLDKSHFSRIIDVDQLGFGDKLIVIGATKALLIREGLDAVYPDYWCKALVLTDEHYAAVNFYCAVHCIVYLAEAALSTKRESAKTTQHSQRIRNLQLGLKSTLNSFK